MIRYFVGYPLPFAAMYLSPDFSAGVGYATLIFATWWIVEMLARRWTYPILSDLAALGDSARSQRELALAGQVAELKRGQKFDDRLADARGQLDFEKAKHRAQISYLQKSVDILKGKKK
jgi:hypothetical protein